MAHITIPDADARIAYSANGAQTVFPIPWPFFATTDVNVYLDGELQTAGYTVTGTAVDGGFAAGDVIFAAAPAAGTEVVLLRVIPIQRLTDFPYPSQTLDIRALNTELDRIFAIMRDLKRRTELAVRVLDYEPTLSAGVGPHTYDLWIGHSGGPWQLGDVLWEGHAVRSFRISSAGDFRVHLHTAPTLTWEATLKVAGVPKATVAVGSGANNGGVTLLAGPITVNDGDLIELVDDSGDATARGIAVTARGVKI